MSVDFVLQSTRNRGNHHRRLHAGIIMDGNGRWATARGLPRIAGHRAGADAARRVIEAAPGLGVGTLTLYAFSSDNWRRPSDEVSALMDLMGMYLASEADRCVENGVRLEVIGRRDRLSPELAGAISRAELETARGRKLLLRIAVDYSARDTIARAAGELARNGALSREGLARVLAPELDLLVRTGGEQRLSDFLLWECAYAELIFSRLMWPEFDGAALAAAVREFYTRERRFGAVPPAAPPRSERAEAWLD